MRILLDTNIFIPLEDSSINIDEKLVELNRIVSGNHQLLVHPATMFDLERDKNKERREKIIPRLKKYLQLESPPSFDEGEEELLMGKPKKDNDRIDNLILLALKRNCVHWLITEDNGIHNKAKSIGEQERVLRIEQAVNALKQGESDSNIYPNIEHIFCYSIDIKNSFFDSLREAYNYFDTWFNKCAREGRKTWICRERNNIHAICIYKGDERDPIITIDKKVLEGKVLKLCTFKVAKYGYKIGELLLKQAFTHAISNKIDYIYVTVEPNKHKQLEELFSDFGFYNYGVDTNGRDLIFVKEFPKNFPETNDSPLEYAIKYFPLIKISKNSVYIVPIQPDYHKILFPELNNQADLFTGINSAGNTIKKAYLCHASTNSIKQGDILFFYKSQDEKAITSYGIVDQFHIENDPDNILKWVGKRTVYADKDIKEMAYTEVKVILFRLIGHLDNYVDFDRLKAKKIVNGSIQSITKIPNEKVKDIIYEAKLNNRVLSD